MKVWSEVPEHQASPAWTDLRGHSPGRGGGTGEGERRGDLRERWGTFKNNRPFSPPVAALLPDKQRKVVILY